MYNVIYSEVFKMNLNCCDFSWQQKRKKGFYLDLILEWLFLYLTINELSKLTKYSFHNLISVICFFRNKILSKLFIISLLSWMPKHSSPKRATQGVSIRDRVPGIPRLRSRKSGTGTGIGTHNKIRDWDWDCLFSYTGRRFLRIPATSRIHEHSWDAVLRASTIRKIMNLIKITIFLKKESNFVETLS